MRLAARFALALVFVGLGVVLGRWTAPAPTPTPKPTPARSTETPSAMDTTCGQRLAACQLALLDRPNAPSTAIATAASAAPTATFAPALPDPPSLTPRSREWAAWWVADNDRAGQEWREREGEALLVRRPNGRLQVMNPEEWDGEGSISRYRRADGSVDFPSQADAGPPEPVLLVQLPDGQRTFVPEARWDHVGTIVRRWNATGERLHDGGP